MQVPLAPVLRLGFSNSGRFRESILALPLQYHESVDRLLIFVFGPLVFAAALLVIATSIRRAITRFRSPPTPDQMKATYDAYLRRLLNPQPEAVERELGTLLPARLLQFYQNKT